MIGSDGIVTRWVSGDAAGVATAADMLRAGKLGAFPTETVYGLGADARDPVAVAKIYAAKGRPAFNPLIAHVATTDDAFALGLFDDSARALASAFWPGPLTLVVPYRSGAAVCELARAGLDTVAVRVPSHPIAQALLRACGFPVVAPSANRSGRISPTQADHVRAELEGRIDLIIDGGPTTVGLESTIVACLGETATLLRAGGVTRAQIEAVLGKPLAVAGGAIVAPGMLAQHYAPDAPVRLDAGTVNPCEAVLLFGAARPTGLEQAAQVLNLSESGDLVEAAANLYGFLRRLDAAHPAGIAVVPIPRHGLGEAIADRLARAAAGSTAPQKPQSWNVA